MRLYGLETEYGLAMPEGTPKTQIEDSRRVVCSCQVPHVTGWDYALETPRNDLRGFTASRLQHDPVDAQWDRDATRIDDERADRILINGARFYNDHGHPEYATPECSRILELVTHDVAGDRIAMQAAKQQGATLYKNNSDYSGASYGTHENYLVDRTIGYERLATGLLPLMVCRQLFVGAGKVGSEVGKQCDYQLSQRADFMTEVAAVDTLYRRPIFNTRDEPHADREKWMRLHVICGDANRSEWATAMKFGMMRIGLELVAIDEAPVWQLANPVQAFSEVSRDTENCWRIGLHGGSWTTAPDVLGSYLAAARQFLQGEDAEMDWILNEWEQALTDLKDDPTKLADRADWAAKLQLFSLYSDKWDVDTLRSVEMDYHDIDPEISLYTALVESDRMRKLTDDARVDDAITIPPNTRAKHRGEIISRQADRIEAIGWRRAIVAGEVIDFEVDTEPNTTEGAS
ncbi:MAG: proteasome accessory factor PafA2 family protein [Fimbriimonadales bacterium]